MYRDRPPHEDPARSIAQQAFFATQSQGIPLNAPLVDNERLGSFWVRVGVSIPTTGISVPHSLGRTPSGFIVVDNQTGSVIYRTIADRALATPASITLRAGISLAVATILIC